MKIYDTFPFDGELDLLEHRLRTTYDGVDAFVLVEAGETYSGLAKELTFAKNRDRFAWAEPKLRVVTLAGLGGKSRSARKRAAAQRDAVRLALRDASDDDVVMLLDVDELPSASLLERLRRDGLTRPRRVAMTRHHQYADLVAPRSPCCPPDPRAEPLVMPYAHPGGWHALDGRWWSTSAVVVPYASLRANNAFDLRFGTDDPQPLAGGGRHYSSVDPSTRLERKLHRVFHTEWTGPRETSPAHLERCRRHGVHHRGWWLAERPEGELPTDVAALAAMTGTSALPPLRRRRLVRTWSWLRLWRVIPQRLVQRIDDRFEWLLPVVVVPLLIAAAARYAADSMTRKPRRDMSSTNASTSRSHVDRSTA